MTQFWNNTHRVCPEPKIGKPIIYKSLEAIKHKGLNRITEISKGRIYLMEENRNFNSFGIFKHFHTPYAGS
jgi:hypothetical protein